MNICLKITLQQQLWIAEKKKHDCIYMRIKKKKQMSHTYRYID